MPKSRGGIYLFKADIFQIWRHGGLRASDKNKKTSISCPTLDDLPPRCPQGGLSSHIKWELESSSFPWFWDASGRVNDKGLWKWWGRGRRTYPAFTKCRAGPSVCRGSYHLHGDSVRQVRGLRFRGAGRSPRIKPEVGVWAGTQAHLFCPRALNCYAQLIVKNPGNSFNFYFPSYGFFSLNIY